MDFVPPISISGICERDIDLLLLEEFMSSREFVEWFAGKTCGEEARACVFVNARRSVAQSDGESDIEVNLELTNGQISRLLIENKVNAGLQPKQAERYRSRGDSYVEQGACQRYRTVIVAPSRYFGSNGSLKGFDAFLTYEELVEWFGKQTSLGGRATYKMAVLQAAIEKGVLGYQIIEDDFVSDFWKSYWMLACQIAPELEMPEPTRKPSDATFVSFRPGVYPKGVDLVHKLGHGNIDLQLRGMGERLYEVTSALDGYLLPGVTVAKAGKSTAIRIRVPVLSVARSFDEQVGCVQEGLQAAKVLHAWVMAHRDRLLDLLG